MSFFNIEFIHHILFFSSLLQWKLEINPSSYKTSAPAPQKKKHTKPDDILREDVHFYRFLYRFIHISLSIFLEHKIGGKGHIRLRAQRKLMTHMEIISSQVFTKMNWMEKFLLTLLICNCLNKCK